MVNGTASYLLALIITNVFYAGVTVLAANGFRIPVEIGFNGIHFPISDYSAYWTGDAIRVIFISGPGACLVWGFVFLGLSINLPGRWEFTRELTFWLSLHGFNLALGGIVAGVLTSSGFAWFAKWIYLNETARFFISLLSLFLLAAIGIALSKPALKTAPGLWFIKEDQRLLFLFSSMLVPWVVATALTMLLRYPVFPLHDIILLGTPGIILITILGNNQQHRAEDLEQRFLDQLENGKGEQDWREKLHNHRGNNGVRWLVIAAVILLLSAYRLFFREGVIFG